MRAGWRWCRGWVIRTRTGRIFVRRRSGRRRATRSGSSATAGWGAISTTRARAAIRRWGSASAGRCRRLYGEASEGRQPGQPAELPLHGRRPRAAGRDRQHGGVVPQAEPAGAEAAENSGGTVSALSGPVRHAAARRWTFSNARRWMPRSVRTGSAASPAAWTIWRPIRARSWATRSSWWRS